MNAMTSCRVFASFRATWKPGASVCVVMTSGGYPGAFETSKPIRGLPAASANGVVFHAGTRREGANYYTSGGRVLGITATGADLSRALSSCYDICSIVAFDGAHFRRDIGKQASQHVSAD